MDSAAPVPGACLLFGGEPQVSEGLYRQSGYELRLRGADTMQHHIVHLHEIHHKSLDDDTAWGALMRIAAAHPGWRESLLPWLVSTSGRHEQPAHGGRPCHRAEFR